MTSGSHDPPNTEPDWKGIAELSIIAKIIREKHTYFTGEAEIHPLYINDDRIAKYRGNFISGTNSIDFNGKNHEQRRMIATAYIVVRWINCLNTIDTTNRNESCWEPVPISIYFNICKQLRKVNKF